MEKIKKRQKLDVIESVSLENSNFGVAGEDAESIGKTSEIERASCTRNVGRIWSEIANIVSQLPTLEVLNLSRNRIAEMSPKIEIGTSFSNLRSLIQIARVYRESVLKLSVLFRNWRSFNFVVII